jgi:hypothetical protein
MIDKVMVYVGFEGMILAFQGSAWQGEIVQFCQLSKP